MVTLTVNPAQFASSPSSFLSQQSFAQKILNFTFYLSQNPATPQPNLYTGLGGIQSNQLSFAGLRASCRISNATGPSGSMADVHIWGLPQSVMNQLTTTGMIGNLAANNQIQISAGVSTGSDASAAAANAAPPQGFPVVFGGAIALAVGDYNQMPNVPLHIIAKGGFNSAMTSSVPTSYTGKTSVVKIMQTFAGQLKSPNGQPVIFENNGVTTQLSNPYFPGNLLQQIDQAASQAGIFAQIVDGGTKLAIWPTTGARKTQNIPLISPSTGMIGYPTFGGQAGMMWVRMVYNPNVTFGGQINVQSSIPQANGIWNVRVLDYALDSLVPDGEWMIVAQVQSASSPLPTPTAPTVIQ